jgi:hypothetical protein
MRRHDAYLGVIRSTCLVFAIGFAWSSFALAEEPTSPPIPSDQSVQERAVPRKESGLNKLKGATVQGNQITALPGYTLQPGANNQMMIRPRGGGVTGGSACACQNGAGACVLTPPKPCGIDIGDVTCSSCVSATGNPCQGSCGFGPPTGFAGGRRGHAVRVGEY